MLVGGGAGCKLRSGSGGGVCVVGAGLVLCGAATGSVGGQGLAGERTV